MASTTANRHIFGRDVLARAWPTVTGETPSIPELQIAGAVCELETNYGRGWKGAGANSNNWGAVLYSPHPIAGPTGCPAGVSFANTDSSPGKEPELRCFRCYATPEEGAAHVIRLLTLKRPYSWAAMKRGDIDSFSRDMHRTVYYQGTSLDPEVNIDRHASAVWKHVQAISEAIGEPIAARRGGDEGRGSTEGPAAGLVGTFTGVCVGGAIAWLVWELAKR